jgi:5-methyltetrahydropteroyltriglutamate--homocysteine methyltransferase
MLKVNADAYSFEAANARHEHDYHVWEDVKLPDRKERLVQDAERVDRERVIAGADCGFSPQATYRPKVNPRVMWAKFDTMPEGARLATRQLWR